MSDAATPVDGVIAFEYERSRYDMVFDMKAIAFFEREAGLSIVTAFSELQDAAERKEAPKISILAFLMQAGLRRHHPEVDLDRAGKMALDSEVQAAMGIGLAAAVGEADADSDSDDASAEGNVLPPKRRSRSTGTTSSRQRSKQG